MVCAGAASGLVVMVVANKDLGLLREVAGIIVFGGRRVRALMIALVIPVVGTWGETW